MPPGQAFGVAVVIVLAVFGYLYIVWRSTAVDRTAFYLRTAISALSVSMLAGGGTFFLLFGEPNIPIAIGVCIHLYAAAFKRGFMWWCLFQFWVLKRVTQEAVDRPQQA